MPGIAGIIQKSNHDTSRSDQLVRTMVERMAHEKSWNLGEESFPKLGLSAGWVTRPGSYAEKLPVWNEDRSVGLIFSGEEFGVDSDLSSVLRRLSSASGHPTSALGPPSSARTALREINGWFSGLLIDLREEKVILFNDRYGLGRVYLHESPDGVVSFASEAKALLAIHPATRELDSRGLAEWFSVGCVLQNRTLFKGISLLPPGSQWTFHRDGRIEKERYFDPQEWEQQEPLDAAAYADQLQEVFSRIAPRYLRGPSPVAMSLTGGLDSRMLLAWSGAKPGTLPCYTFGGPYRDCSDVRIARRLAAIANQPHTTIPVDDGFFENFNALAGQAVYLSDGTMDVSGAVELHVNRKAREIAPIRLTGNYGSEILRSNVAFRPRRLDTSLFTPEFVPLLDDAAETYRQESEASGSRHSFIAFKQVPWHHYSRFSVENSQLTPRSPFLDNDLVALAYRVPPEIATSPDPVLRLIANSNPALDTVGTDRALRHRPLPLFSKLAHAWQEFTAKAEYAYDYGMPQKLTRIDRHLSPLHLERLFLGRHKFYHFRIWYKERLKDQLQSLRDSLTLPDCYQTGAGTRLIDAHISGQRNHTLELHKLLSLHFVEHLLVQN